MPWPPQRAFRAPAAVIRGLPWQPDEEATMQLIIRESERDLFR
ncbi:MAG: hypothetical protein WHT63_08135 [Tepidiforma sp.]